MWFKAVKIGIVSTAALAAVGGVLLGRDLGSYVGTAARSVRSSVTDSVPVEFQIRRARDLLDDVVPALHADVRAIAQQEVEVEAARRDLDGCRAGVAADAAAAGRFRDALATAGDAVRVDNISYARDAARDELAARLTLVKEARAALSAKQQLLTTRERALAAAEQALERAKVQRATLEGQIAALESQHKLLQATEAGSGTPGLLVDDTKLAQTQRVIDEVKRQLDVSEHVMAHEAKLATPAAPAASEQDVLREAAVVLGDAK